MNQIAFNTLAVIGFVVAIVHAVRSIFSFEYHSNDELYHKILEERIKLHKLARLIGYKPIGAGFQWEKVKKSDKKSD